MSNVLISINILASLSTKIIDNLREWFKKEKKIC